MGLLEVELKEIRQDLKHYRAGKISEEQVQTLIGMYSQTEKRMRLALKVASMASKYGKKHIKQLLQSNLIGNGTVIDLSPEEIEEEKILCPLKGTLMTRAECLDFSGEEQNFEDCAKCDVGLENKKLMITDAPLFTA